MKINQKITILAMIGFGLFNPFTVAVLEDWFRLVYTVTFVACGVWIGVYVLYKALKPEPTNIPKKSQKTAKQKYLIT